MNPTLANDMGEALRKKFLQMTRLEQVDEDGDLQISGEISGYSVSTSSVTAAEAAAMNRLTVTVRVNFDNIKYSEESFSGKSFSAYADFSADSSLDSVQDQLCTTIIDEIVENIFNATVAQW